MMVRLVAARQVCIVDRGESYQRPQQAAHSCGRPIEVHGGYLYGAGHNGKCSSAFAGIIAPGCACAGVRHYRRPDASGSGDDGYRRHDKNRKSRMAGLFCSPSLVLIRGGNLVKGF